MDRQDRQVDMLMNKASRWRDQTDRWSTKQTGMTWTRESDRQDGQARLMDRQGKTCRRTDRQTHRQTESWKDEK